MQGKVLVLLSICVLPVIHDAVQFRPESVNSLCEHNLLQDDAREILEATFDTFKDWAQGYCLTHSTIQRLASEGLDSRIALSFADELDIAALRLNIGQRNILKVVVKKLREAISRKAREEKEREAAQKQISVERRGRSGSNNDRNIVTGAIGGAMLGIGTLLAAPYALAAVGFTSAGVALGSLGASMMSSAAIANGGGIAAGSTVAVLQSISAAGISVAAETAVVGGGALLGAGAAYMGDNDMEY